jgi:hypothetical protein
LDLCIFAGARHVVIADHDSASGEPSAARYRPE